MNTKTLATAVATSIATLVSNKVVSACTAVVISATTIVGSQAPSLSYTALCGTMSQSRKTVCINQYGSRLYYEVTTTAGRTELKIPVTSVSNSTFTARNGDYTYIANYSAKAITVKQGSRVISTIRMI